jgi:hypothetical protein
MVIKKLFSVFALAILVCTGLPPRSVHSHAAQVATDGQSDAVLRRAFKNRTSNIQVEGSGTVVKVLPDDTKGSRHQRFILRLRSGQTLLITHNTDLAPRLSSIRKGDVVEFYGEYEWNAKGGVIHWTHLDPAGRHVAGWLKHKGQIYH